MKLLVVGTGSIGKRHAANAAKLVRTGVFDRDTETARGVADELGADLIVDENRLWDWRPDGVIVATPHNTHLDMARKSVLAGADVLIEKPISNSLEGTTELVAEAKKLSRKVFVVTNMRFHPAILAMQAALPKLGEVLFSRAQYGNYLPAMRPDADYRTLYAASREAGGGVVLDAIHEIDYLRWLLGPVVNVTAVAAKISNLDIDVEDYAAMTLEHESGARSEIHLDYLQQYKQRGCMIAGTKGTVIWQSDGKRPEKCTVSLFETSSGKWQVLVDEDDLDNAQPYCVLVEEFVKSLQGKPSKLAAAQEGIEALQIALAALEAARLKRTLEIEQKQ